MKKLLSIITSCLFLSVLVVPTFDIALGNDEGDSMPKSVRPGLFKELANTKIICMKTCHKKVDSVFGIKVICGDYEPSLFDASCQNSTGHTPVEYCNCDESQCAKFFVECSKDGTVCDVRMGSLGIPHTSCECNGNTCEAAGSGFATASCFMRKEVEANTCDLHRMVGFSDGRSYQITCDGDKTACVSEGMKIDSSIEAEQLPTATKPGEPK